MNDMSLTSIKEPEYPTMLLMSFESCPCDYVFERGQTSSAMMLPFGPDNDQ